jgi:hypothetical protein
VKSASHVRGHSGTLAQAAILSLDDHRNGDSNHKLNSEIKDRMMSAATGEG